jgi:DNA-binding NarL/FixJ family response regulator
MASPVCFAAWPHRLHCQAAVFAQVDSAGGDDIGTPRRVLVVEDDFLVAGELEHWLAAAGFHVIGPAATAGDAIALAAVEKPDLVIMDVRLAGARDGVETAIFIYKEFGVRSVFATAQSDSMTIARSQAANPVGWVAKPYDPAGLVAKIKGYFKD